MRSETTLEVTARALLLSSIRTIGESRNKFIYPSDDGVVNGIVDTTSTLIAARALSKLGRSDISWEFVRTLFHAQGNNGFLPRYVYLNRTTVYDEGAGTHIFEGAEWNEFVGEYPGPKLFPNAPKNRAPPSSSMDESDVRIWSSNTISASPYHATSVLELFYLSNQTDADVQMLLYFHTKLHKWHDYLHTQIILNCTSSNTAFSSRTVNHMTPCLTIVHPWESEIELTSPLWKYALDNVTQIVIEQGWKPKFEVPTSIKGKFDYPGDGTYSTLLYLLENLSIDEDDVSLFQLVDVGFTSALTKADQDLQTIDQILVDKHVIAQPSRYAMDLAAERSHRSKGMLHRMWNDDEGSFFIAIVNNTLNDKTEYSSNYTTMVELPLGSNFNALWTPLLNSTMLEPMSSHLLESSGRYSFNCGVYPIWSYGHCDKSDNNSALINLLLNYRVSKGLRYNNEGGLAHYLESSTLNLICGLPNADELHLIDCTAQQSQMAWAFNATSHQPLGRMTSTLTAAIVLDFFYPDKLFKYESGPPISASGVIVLIAMELVVAFLVGSTCLLLSLNLMRRAKADEEGDTFVQIIRDQQPEIELLVQSPGDDSENNESTNDAGTWGLLSLSSLIPFSFWSSGASQ